MSDTLLIILIGLMSLTLLVLSWATIALLVQARKELPVLRQRVDELNMRLGRVLEETVPALQTTTQALQEAHRALHEAAETIENLHIVSDNIRHKLEVADEVAGKVRRVPEKAARALGRLMHYAFKLGGQLLLQRLQGRGDQRVKPLPSTSFSASQRMERTELSSPASSEGVTATDSAPTGAENASLTEANPTTQEGGMIDESR
jgi:hypothetical protein